MYRLTNITKQLILDQLTNNQFTQLLNQQIKQHNQQLELYQANVGPQQHYYDFIITVRTNDIDVRVKASQLQQY